MLTQRQKFILDGIINQYTNSAEPVSSQALEERYDFGIASAMIRREMQRLSELGYVCQPHTSAGRVPTDKGYRFFVDELLKTYSFDDGPKDTFELNEKQDEIKIIQAMTKALSRASSAFTLSYFAKAKLLWKDGWETILREPEFKEGERVTEFIDLIASAESFLDDFTPRDKIDIYIGAENPFGEAKDFSALIAPCRFRKGAENGLLILLGPKRMGYKRNISLLNYAANLLKDI